MEREAVFSLLQQNLLSLTALPRTVFLILLPALWAIQAWPPPWRRPSATQQTVNQMWLLVMVATLATAGIGFLGIMPWIVGTRWSIAEIGLIGLSLLGLGAIAVNLGFLRVKVLYVFAAIASTLVSLFAGYRLYAYERFPGHNWGAILPLILAGAPGKTVIDTEVYTDLRYWLELSGDYDSYRMDWINHQPQTTSVFEAANASSIRDFLDSSNDRLLLGNAILLDADGIQIPEGIRVIPVPNWDGASNATYPEPVLLVRDRSVDLP